MKTFGTMMPILIRCTKEPLRSRIVSRGGVGYLGELRAVLGSKHWPRWGPRNISNESKVASQLEYLIFSTSHFSSTLPHVHIYAVIGLVEHDIPQHLYPNYSLPFPEVC